MDEQAASVSPELLAANRRLYELRAQAQAARQAAGQPPVEPAWSADAAAPWENAPAQPDDVRTLAEKISALPEHLGWGSAALTTVIRRQQRLRRQQTTDDTGAEDLADAVSAAVDSVAAPEDSSRAVDVALDELAEGAADHTDESVGEVDDAGDSCSSGRREQVKLYPDIGLGMLRNEQTAAGRLWLLLRHLDGVGQGVLRIDITQQTLTTPTSIYYLCSKRQLRNLLQAGEGVFWTRDNNRIWLRSAARVAHALGVERLTGRPVALPLSALLNGIGAFRAHLYTAFHSSRTKEAAHGSQAMPISRAALAELSGVGGSSQRAYEARAGVEVQTNYAVGEAATKEATENRAWRHGRALFELKDHRGRQGRAGQTYLAWQLPNSYIGSHTQQPKGRQKRINRKLRDLVIKGTPGNGEGAVEPRAVDAATAAATAASTSGPKPGKRYYPNGKLAAKASGRGVDRQRYWREPRSRAGRQAIWQQVECAGGRA